MYIFLGIFMMPILFLGSFDRYFLPLTLTVVILISLQSQKIKIQYYSYAALILFAFFSISQTQFYLNWNRARAELFHTTIANIESNPQHRKIDGGYEWDGWYGYWDAYYAGVNRGFPNSPWWIKFLMTNNTADYVISSSPLQNYDVIENKKVPGLNPNNTLFVLLKK